MHKFFSCLKLKKFGQLGILFSAVTSLYVVDQSMISICDIKKMLGGDAKLNPLDSAYTVMLIN